MLLLDVRMCSPNDEITTGDQFGERMEVGMGGFQSALTKPTSNRYNLEQEQSD